MNKLDDTQIVRCFMGIDPGKTGAIAVVNEIGKLVRWYSLGKFTDEELWETIHQELTMGVVFVVQEKINAVNKPGMTVQELIRRQPLLRSAHVTWGVLVGLPVQREEVTPQRWQKSMQCHTKGDKKVSRQRAQELFPGGKFPGYAAEAAIIAEYGRRIYNQRNGSTLPPTSQV